MKFSNPFNVPPFQGSWLLLLANKKQKFIQFIELVEIQRIVLIEDLENFTDTIYGLKVDYKLHDYIDECNTLSWKYPYLRSLCYILEHKTNGMVLAFKLPNNYSEEHLASLYNILQHPTEASLKEVKPHIPEESLFFERCSNVLIPSLN